MAELPGMITNRIALWLLDRVPLWCRSRWPLRRFYWQREDIEAAKREAEELHRELGW